MVIEEFRMGSNKPSLIDMLPIIELSPHEPHMIKKVVHPDRDADNRRVASSVSRQFSVRRPDRGASERR